MLQPLRTTFEKLVNHSPKPMVSCANMDTWFEEHLRATKGEDNSLIRAILGGARFRQLGFAFASAYQSALENMFSSDKTIPGALCHTEKGIKKPRDMATVLSKNAADQLIVSGHKSFVSGGLSAGKLFVSAIDERQGNRPVVVLELDSKTAGLELTPGPALPFVPELSHAELCLNDVRISTDNILPGDGYLNYIKPFRTEEDMHILAALLGQRCNIASEFGQHDLVERYLPVLAALLCLHQQERSDPAGHIALSGIKAQCIDLFETHDKQLATDLPDFVASWTRDKALLRIAEAAQKVRTKKAFDYFDLSG